MTLYTPYNMYKKLWGKYLLCRKMANVVEVDFDVDVSDVKKGVLHLLSYVRPQWKEEDVSMKVCMFCLFIHLLQSLDYQNKCEPLFNIWI